MTHNLSKQKKSVATAIEKTRLIGADCPNQACFYGQKAHSARI